MALLSTCACAKPALHPAAPPSLPLTLGIDEQISFACMHVVHLVVITGREGRVVYRELLNSSSRIYSATKDIRTTMEISPVTG